MTLHDLVLVLEGLAVLGAATFVFVLGHWWGHRSRRFDYPNGFDSGEAAGIKAERHWWEHAAGITRETLARLQAADQAPQEGPEPRWPYGFREDPALPATEVLLAEADERLGKRPHVPSVAELDQMVAEYESSRAPVVADLTGPDAWHYPGDDDVPTLTGLVVKGSPRDRTGPEWLQAQLAAMDSETDAYLRRMKADVALSRRGITSGSAS